MILTQPGRSQPAGVDGKRRMHEPIRENMGCTGYGYPQPGDFSLTALLVVVGFAGLLLPAVPCIPLVFVGLVLLAWADDFAYVGWITLTLLGVLALLSYGVDLRPRRNKVRCEPGAGGNRRGAGTLTAFEDATRSG